MAVRIPRRRRRSCASCSTCAQFVQSHALSFFHLSAPDLLLGMDYDPAKRNVAGLLEEHPDALRDGIALRKFGQQAIERLARERVHPSWTVPGGVNQPLDPAAREKTSPSSRGRSRSSSGPSGCGSGPSTDTPPRSSPSRTSPRCTAARWARRASSGCTTGSCASSTADGNMVADQVRRGVPGAHRRGDAPGLLPQGAVLPADRLPATASTGWGRSPGSTWRTGSPRRSRTRSSPSSAQRYGRIVQSGFHYHYARLIEALYAPRADGAAARRSGDPGHQGPRARRRERAPKGRGSSRRPRGTLIHHYKVDDNGAITWVNLIVATGHNNLAMGRGVKQVAQAVRGRPGDPGGRAQPGVGPRPRVRPVPQLLHARAGHGGGRPAARDADGELLDEVATG